jgi:hypothetical protein
MIHSRSNFILDVADVDNIIGDFRCWTADAVSQQVGMGLF